MNSSRRGRISRIQKDRRLSPPTSCIAPTTNGPYYSSTKIQERPTPFACDLSRQKAKGKTREKGKGKREKGKEEDEKTEDRRRNEENRKAGREEEGKDQAGREPIENRKSKIENPITPSHLRGRVDVFTFSSAQYVWHPRGAHGY